MFGIDYIDIEIYNFNYKLLVHIDLIKREYTCGEITRMILPKEIEDLISIIRSWKNEYSKEGIIDGEEFRIIIYSKDDQEILHGKGDYPVNYPAFKEWLGGLYVG